MKFHLQGVLMDTPILSNRTTVIDLKFIKSLGNIAVKPIKDQNKILEFDVKINPILECVILIIWITKRQLCFFYSTISFKQKCTI